MKRANASTRTVAVRILGGAIVVAALLCGWLASARANLLLDSNFSQFTGSYTPPGTIGAQITNSNLPNWQWVNVTTPSNSSSTSGNYGFVLDGSSIAGGTSVYQQAGTGQPGTNINTNGTAKLGLYGSGSADGSTIPRDPAGNSHAYAADGAYQQAYFFQPVSLVTGGTYIVSFYMSAGQQVGYPLSGPAPPLHGVSCGSNCALSDFQVGLGACAVAGQPGAGCTTTNAKIAPSITLSGTQGWRGASATQWMFESMSFIAQAGATALWFLAESSAPSCQPPFVLLSDVSMVLLPEPPAYGVLLVALLGLFGLRRIRRRKS